MATIAAGSFKTDNEAHVVTITIASERYGGSQLDLVLSKSPLLRLDCDGEEFADVVFSRVSLELEIIVQPEMVDVYAEAFDNDYITCEIRLDGNRVGVYDYVNQSNRWSVGEINKMKLTFTDRINKLKNEVNSLSSAYKAIESYNGTAMPIYSVLDEVINKSRIHLNADEAVVVGDVVKCTSNGNAIQSYILNTSSSKTVYGGVWNALINYRQIANKSLYDIVGTLARAFGYLVFFSDNKLMMVAKNALLTLEKSSFEVRTAHVTSVSNNTSVLEQVETIDAINPNALEVSRFYTITPKYNVSVKNDYGLALNLHYTYDHIIKTGSTFGAVFGSLNSASLSVVDGKLRVTYANKTTINPKHNDYIFLPSFFCYGYGKVKSLTLKVVVDDVASDVNVFATLVMQNEFFENDENYIAYPGESAYTNRAAAQTFGTPKVVKAGGDRMATITWALTDNYTSLNVIIAPPTAIINGVTTKVDFTIEAISVESYFSTQVAKGETVNIVTDTSINREKVFETFYGSTGAYIYDSISFTAQPFYPIVVANGKYTGTEMGLKFRYDDEATPYELNEMLGRLYATLYKDKRKMVELEGYAYDLFYNSSYRALFMRQPLRLYGGFYFPISGSIDILSGKFDLTCEQLTSKFMYMVSEAGDDLLTESGSIMINEH